MSQTITTRLPFLKKFLFSLLLMFLICVFFDVLASVVLIYRYRVNGLLDEPSHLSSVVLLHKAAVRAGLAESVETGYEYDKRTSPDPFLVPDPVFGYCAPPGKYVHSYLKRSLPDGDWEALKIKVTMNPDGSRWTGDSTEHRKPLIYVFGDSSCFGSGVNDEQTFSYQLQQAMPDREVKLFALAGYSLTQAYLRFRSLQTSVGPDDIIVLGYADYFDVRHVVDPERLREIHNWKLRFKTRQLHARQTLPRAQLQSDGTIEFDYVEANCLYNDGLCEAPSISDIVKSKTTAALINAISRGSPARVYLLHFEGAKENPVLDLIDERIHVVSALPEDFDHFYWDDIEGFDPHPGPFWHYTISQKLVDSLNNALRGQ